MGRKAAIKYRSLRSNLIHLPLSLFAQLAQQQARPQSLILHISPLTSYPSSSSSSRQPKSAHLGWSGLAAASSLAQAGEGVENVEVDPEVAMSLGWSEGMLVEISVIHNPTKARSVSVTPLTSDDWEILEQHAAFLENHLLSQLRAAQKGQELDVWVMGRTKIRIRVDDTDPASSTNTAVLVNPDTEIYVAPRPRLSNPQTQHTTTPTASASNISNMVNGHSTSRRGLKMRLIPPRVAAVWGRPDISPSQLANVQGSSLALCSRRSFSRIKRKLALNEDKDLASVKISEVSDDEVGGPTGHDEDAKEERPKREAELQMLAWDEMPDGHVVIVGKMEDWLNSWNNVAVTSTSDMRKGRIKSAKGKPIPALNLSYVTSSHPLPGLDKVHRDAVDYLRRSESEPLTKPLLLLGGKGSGKSSLAKSIAESLESDREFLAETLYDDVGKIDPESRLTTIKETMDGWLERARSRCPCVLVLDGLDNLISPETELASSANPAILANYFCRLIAPSSLPTGVLVLVTAKDSTALHPSLTAKHVFGETIKIPPLTKEVRREILQSMVKAHVDHTQGAQVNGDAPPGLDYVLLGTSTEGYSAADLSDLVGGAMQQAVIRCSKGGERKIHLTGEDFALAQATFTPLSLRDVRLQKSDTKWSDIGGLSEPRRVLRETLEWPTKYAQIFANCPLRLRSGLLLYGYPGCGKTLLASAVAKECGLNFISVKGPEILNKYIGASEKAVRDLFERASGAKPCVLFFDEFDSIAPKRGHDSTGVTDRVVNQMLTEMDGAQGLEGVYVLAATSRPDLIDPALLRPGRLDKSILCDMPAFPDRMEILEAVGKKLALGSSVDWEEIASETEGFSGADLQGLVYGAHLEVVHSSLDDSKGRAEAASIGKGKGKGKEEVNGKKEHKGYRQVAPEEGTISAASRAEIASRIDTIVKNSSRQSIEDDGESLLKHLHKPVIEQEHLLRSLSNTRPSVSVADKRRLEIIYRSFVNERDGKMGDGNLGRDTGTRVSLM
ncbi:hypothetical protein IAR55_002653 [Kwoniella newhampshirensis]|uniref:Peroxisomal ATPase PEX1 n=1 Tax=Kwoniella newhampshirensis TaxID=1651941 RepID=A0AAW0YZX3_9TREE